MRNQEKGFTYPLTLCLLIVFILFFSMQVDRLVSERKIAYESQAILQEEYYFLSSVKKIEAMLLTAGSIPSTGAFQYKNGRIQFTTEPVSGTIQKVNFTLSLHSGHRIIGQGTFDTRTKKLTNWFELK